MTQKKCSLGLSLVFIVNLLCIASTDASEDMPFMEADISYLSLNGDYANAGFGETSSSSVSFFYHLGIPFYNYYAAEAIIGTGISNDSSPIADIGVNSLLGALFKGSYPVAKDFEAFGRVGIVRFSIDLNKIKYVPADTFHDAYSKTGLMLEVGATYDFGEYGKVLIQSQQLPGVELGLGVKVKTSGIGFGYQM